MKLHACYVVDVVKPLTSSYLSDCISPSFLHEVEVGMLRRGLGPFVF